MNDNIQERSPSVCNYFTSFHSELSMSLRPPEDERSLTSSRTTDSGAKHVSEATQEVVDEAAFVDAIGSILDRDFFPELPKLRAYNEWLDALEAKDFVKMSEIRAKWRRVDAKKRQYSAIDTPAIVSLGMSQETPYTEAKRYKTTEENYETLHSTFETRLSQDAKNMTLDAFLSKYTGEDDASFAKLKEKETSAARRVYQEAYDMASKEHEKMLAEGRLIGWKQYDASHSSVFTAPLALTYVASLDELKQEKTTIPENTRFPEGGPHWATSSTAHPSSSADFKSPTPISSQNNLDAQIYHDILKRRHDEEIGVSDPSHGPLIRGFDMLSTPKLAPGIVDRSPMITWGEMADEAVKLDQAGFIIPPSTNNLKTTSSGFSVPPISETTRQANSVLKKKTIRKKSAAHLSSPLFHSKNTPLFQMTPDTQLRSSYTPKIRSGDTPHRTPALQTPPIHASHQHHQHERPQGAK